MRIHEEKDGDVLVLQVGDRLDSATAPEFEQRILSVIDAGEHSLLLDFSALDYMNSAGLKALLLAAKKVAPKNGRLVICGLASNVETVFQLTGFDKMFTIKPDRAAARAAFV